MYLRTRVGVSRRACVSVCLAGMIVYGVRGSDINISIYIYCMRLDGRLNACLYGLCDTSS